MTSIPLYPPGLISRRSFAIDAGRVVVEEHWKLDTPGCPMIRNPWNSYTDNGPNIVRQVVMTQAERDALGNIDFG